MNATSDEKIRIEERKVEHVESFVYLGAKVSKSGSTEEDIKKRLGKARAVKTKLGKIWKNSQLTRKLRSEFSSPMLYLW